MKKIKYIISSVVVFFLGTVPFIVRADGCSSGLICNPLAGNTNTIMDFINLVLQNVIMPVAAVASVIAVIWAGFQYVLAQGNDAKLKKAHQTLLYVLIGIGILLGAAAISAVIQSTVKSLVSTS